RNRDKAEVFEQALARVSHRLAEVAEASAAELRNERIADVPPRHPAAAVPPPAKLSPQRIDRRPDWPGLRKRQASTRAVGARRQARRDSR
ncbi:MAG TPA: hypothetical protein VES42_15450, partial [Pilimelia sp.]|nr:hypothetical protein [Pilimelia sp.]HYN95242.1 hypothetical protein [Pilimelia sp.]